MTASGERPRVLAMPEAIDASAVRRLKEHLQATLRPPVKARPASERHLSKAQATLALGAALDELERRGWSLRSIARWMQCSPAMLFEMRAGTRRVSDWAPWRLPPVARAVFAAELAATIDEADLDVEPPSRTGTE